MRKFILVLMLCGQSIFVAAQEASVVNSTKGIQVGVLGIWFHNESKMTNSIAIRSEVGFDSGIFGGSFYDKTGFILTPVMTFEPRWYYNLKARNNKSKRIDSNSGNFLSIKSSLNPDWFVISNYDNSQIINQFSIIPTWGIRRHIGSNFTFETGIGVGYRYYFDKNIENEGGVGVNLHLRFGFKFDKR